MEEKHEPGGKTPNVVWILLDACRSANLGVYGYDRPTSPTMDKLAESGVLFLRHYAQSSKTAYSVPSYMTGRYFPTPCFSKRYSLTLFSFVPPADEIMFGKIMRDNGYATGMFTNMPLFLDTDRLARSFDDFFVWTQGEEVLLQRWVVMWDALLAWLETPRESPFFLYIHASDTHLPHEMVPPYDKWIDPQYDPDMLLPVGFGQSYKRRDGEPFTEEDKEYFRALYDGMIWDADDQIKMLMETLKRLNLFDDTIVLISADHGEIIGEDGYTVGHVGGSSDEILETPLIISGPGIPVGVQVDALSENVDIVPTLVELLSLDTSAHFDGHSLVPLMHGIKPDNWREYIFAVSDRREYTDPLNFVLRWPDIKFKFNAEGKVDKILGVPDMVGNRIHVVDARLEKVSAAEELLGKRFLPDLEALRALPVNAIVIEGAWLAASAQPRESVINHYVSGISASDELERDDKWAFTDGFFGARNDREKAPELSFQFTIPDGVYTVYLKMFNSLNHNGAPASALDIHIEGEDTPRKIISTSLPESLAAVTTTPLGKITVTNNRLAFTFLGGHADYWTLIHSIELFPEGFDAANMQDKEEYSAPAPEEAAEYHELIRGLGYL